MKTLVVDDDFTGRLLLQKILAPYGECHCAVDGQEALDAFQLALRKEEPYDLVCLDIMLPYVNGQDVLTRMRGWERSHGKGTRARIIMTTVLTDKSSMNDAYRAQCDGYFTKPIFKEKLLEFLHAMGLTQEATNHSK